MLLFFIKKNNIASLTLTELDKNDKNMMVNWLYDKTYLRFWMVVHLDPLEMHGYGLDRFYCMPGQHGCFTVIVLRFYTYWQAYWLSLCCFYNMATPEEGKCCNCIQMHQYCVTSDVDKQDKGTFKHNTPAWTNRRKFNNLK